MNTSWEPLGSPSTASTSDTFRSSLTPKWVSSPRIGATSLSSYGMPLILSLSTGTFARLAFASRARLNCGDHRVPGQRGAFDSNWKRRDSRERAEASHHLARFGPVSFADGPPAGDHFAKLFEEAAGLRAGLALDRGRHHPGPGLRDGAS